jgi:predicted Fe-Mo cluster-binding NifX family protein
MKSLKIAIPTNDGITIFPGMLGMAKEIFIYDVVDGKMFILIKNRTNPYELTRQHLKTLDVYDLISDCSVIISGHIGKKGITRLQERRMELFLTKGNIQNTLKEWIAGKQS